MNLKQLEDLTLAWSYERGILQNSKAITQGMKLVSEHGELIGNLANNKDIKDDIGDCLVVLTNLANLTKSIKISECKYVFVSTPTGFILGNLCDNIIKDKNLNTEISELFNALHQLALEANTTLEECWEAAYDDIKDRKGFLNNQGNFIKAEASTNTQLSIDFNDCSAVERYNV